MDRFSLDTLLGSNVWSWWKIKVFQLRSDRRLADAEALFLEFHLPTEDC